MLSAIEKEPPKRRACPNPSMQPSHFCTHILDLPPSCIEFSPKLPNYLVVGTYNLEKEEDQPAARTQSRNGSLLLFRAAVPQLNHIQSISHPSAILDLHFSPKYHDTFAVAGSTGTVSLFKLNGNPETEPSIEHLSEQQIWPEDVLVLSLAWHPTLPDILGVTLSTGTVSILHKDPNTHKLTAVVEHLNQHCTRFSPSLQAWTLAFSVPISGDSHQDVTVVYSGGDDSQLRSSWLPNLNVWSHSGPSTLEIESTESLPSPRRWSGHEAGVVAILPLPLPTIVNDSFLLTGSYDDHLRLFHIHYSDDRSEWEPKILAEVNLGGGVWRLKFLHDYSHFRHSDANATTGCVSFLVLASCMHAGAAILRVEGYPGSSWNIQILMRFEHHESMNYGSDVQPVDRRLEDENQQQDKLVCVSTSFYDRKICLWGLEYSVDKTKPIEKEPEPMVLGLEKKGQS